MENNFNENLKRLRLKTKSTKEEIAKLLDVNVKTYAHWEKRTEPSIYWLIKICKLFGVTAQDMLTTKIT